MGPKPDKIVGGGRKCGGPRARWARDSRPAPPVGLPSGCGLCPISEPAPGLLSSPTRQDLAALAPVSLGILLGGARPASPPPSPGPGCEPQDFMCNRNSENVWGTELGPASVSPAYTLASAIHSHYVPGGLLDAGGATMTTNHP